MSWSAVGPAQAQSGSDATLDALRIIGAIAPQGKITFDLKTRTLTVSDVVIAGTGRTPVTLKLGRLTANGIERAAAGQLSAERVEISDLEIAVDARASADVKVAYHVPKIVITSLSAPLNAPKTDGEPRTDTVRAALGIIAASSTSSISIPTLRTTMEMGAQKIEQKTATAEIIYSDLALRDMRNGRIASASIARSEIMAGGTAGGLRGEIGKIDVLDIDTSAVMALFDAAAPASGDYRQVYRRATVGPYRLSADNGSTARIDAITIDDVGLYPGKLRWPAFVAFLDETKTMARTAPPEQLVAQLEKLAGFYEGFRIGRIELRGVSAEAPGAGAVLVNGMRWDKFDKGRLSEFAVEGVELRNPQAPARLQRLAVKGLGFADLLRIIAVAAAEHPDRAKVAAVGPLIEGIELRGLTAADKKTGKPVTVENFLVEWSRFVGPFPTSMHVAAKMAGPTAIGDPDTARLLAALGRHDVRANLDIGVAWTEADKTVALTPGLIEVADTFSLSASASLGNVSREIFSVDLDPIVESFAKIEAGPIEFKLRDTGGLALAYAWYARMSNMAPDAGRRAFLKDMGETISGTAQAEPSLQPVADALLKFIEAPNGTLTIKLTPKERIPLMQLTGEAKDGPIGLLSKYQIEAATTR